MGGRFAALSRPVGQTGSVEAGGTRRPMRGMKFALGVSVLTALFLAIALWNGFPLVFYDTGGYLAVVIFAFWCGCMASAHLLDRIGRRRNIALFAFCCIVTVLGYVMLPLSNTEMLVLGFPLGFFSAGIPASLGALFNELYPADMRGAGVGFCYNFGRIASACFPALVGYMSNSMSLGVAIGVDAAIAYGVAMVAVLLLPETRSRRLQLSSVEQAHEKIDYASLTTDSLHS